MLDCEYGDFHSPQRDTKKIRRVIGDGGSSCTASTGARSRFNSLVHAESRNYTHYSQGGSHAPSRSGFICSGSSDWTRDAIITSVIITLGLLFWKWRLECRSRAYDKELAQRFSKEWESESTLRKRYFAVKALEALRDEDLADDEAHAGVLRDVDDLLDVLEDLGLYVKEAGLSPELVHHLFYYWIRGYWLTTRDYVETCRKQDPREWENIEVLFKTVPDVEVRKDAHARKEELAWKHADRNDFLEDQLARIRRATFPFAEMDFRDVSAPGHG